MQNSTASSSKIVFVSCFSIADANASNSLILRLTPRSKIRFVMVVAFIDSFKILTTYGCLFFLTLFFAIPIFALGIDVFGITEEVANDGAGIGLSLIGFHSINQIFLQAAYSISFLMRWRNICLTGSLDDFLAG